MRLPIVAMPVLENVAHVTVEMVMKLDDLINYARTGKKAEEIMALQNIKKPQEIYHALQFFGLSITQLRADEIFLVMKEHPSWTQEKVANHFGITVHALRNQIHYRKKKVDKLEELVEKNDEISE